MKELKTSSMTFQSKPEGTLGVKAVLFDFDGTLFDTIPLIVESYCSIYQAFGLRRHSEEEILAGIGLPLEEVLGEYPELQDDLLKEYQRFNQLHLQGHVGIYLGVPAMIKGLREKGFALGVVTAKRLGSLLPTLREFEAESWFDCIVTKEDTDRHKPDPEPLLKGMQALGLSNPAEVLYVGDSVHDLRAARNGGFPSAAVGWSAMPHEDLRAELPTLWVEDAKNLAQMLHLLPEK